MTTSQFILMIGEVETGDGRNLEARERAIGDGGMAAGMYQQHWAWRLDYWPEWCWPVLAVFDRAALKNFLAKHRTLNARALAALYNAGHPEVDADYNRRCVETAKYFGIPESELDKPID